MRNLRIIFQTAAVCGILVGLLSAGTSISNKCYSAAGDSFTAAAWAFSALLWSFMSAREDER